MSFMRTVRAALSGKISPADAAQSLGVSDAQFVADVVRYCTGKGEPVPSWAGSAPAVPSSTPSNNGKVVVHNGRGFIPGTPAHAWRHTPIDYKKAHARALAELEAAMKADPEIRRHIAAEKAEAEARRVAAQKAQAARRAAEAKLAAEQEARRAESARAKAEAARRAAERANAEKAIAKLISAFAGWLAEGVAETARRAAGRAKMALWPAELAKLEARRAELAERRVIDAIKRGLVAKAKRDLLAAKAQSAAGSMRVPVGEALKRAGVKAAH